MKNKNALESKLYTWHKYQKQNYINNKLNDSKKEKWNIFYKEYENILDKNKIWENNLEELKIWIDKNKKRPTSSSSNCTEKNLAIWTYTQYSTFTIKNNSKKKILIRKKNGMIFFKIIKNIL